MAGGKGKGVVAGVERPSVARRMWRVVRAVLYMLRRGVGVGVPSGRKLAMDLHLLLHRGKIAGKALGELVAFHGHHHHGAGFSASSSSFSCRALDPALAVHEPSRGRREVEFSCSTTPSYRRRRHSGRDEAAGAGWYHNYDAAEIAMVFEMLNNDGEHLFNDDASPLALAATATPSPALAWTLPATRRQLRIPDSPFAARDVSGGGVVPAGEHDQLVDRQADEFIRRFYEQLRAQAPQSAAATPDYYSYGASPYSGVRAAATPDYYGYGGGPYSGGRAAARPVAAGIA